MVVTGVSQFFSIMGFAFALPFAPYYMQELGITDPVQLKFWVAMFGAATPLSLAVFSPLWGHLADRYSRRMMLLRANLAGAVVIALMGAVSRVEMLVLLRLLQGMFTGTMTAAQTMVAVQAPSHRSGQALGALTAAVFSGSLTGAFAGGIVADLLGYRIAFLVGGGFLLIAALLVAGWTTEEERGAEPASAAPAASLPRREASVILPVLMLFGLLSFVRQFDVSFLPLLVQEIHGGLAGASIRTGALNAAGGIAGMLAALVLGRMADRRSPARMVIALAIGAGLLMAPQAWAGSFGLLFPVRFLMVFCTGGMDPVMQIWLTRITPVQRRGSVFGWAGTMRSLGWFLAPLGSGLVAAHFGIRSIFVVGALLFLLVLPVLRWTERRAAGDDGSKSRSP